MVKEVPPVTKRSMYFWVLYKNKPLQLTMITIIVITVGMRLVPIEMQKRIVSDAIQLKKVDALIYYCIIYIIAVFTAGILKYAINILQAKVGEMTLYRIRTALYEHILTLPMPFFRRTSPGLVVSTLMTELMAMSTFAGMAISAPLVNILTFFAFAGYMLYLNPLLAALSVAIYPIEMIIIPILQRKYNLLNRQRTQSLRKTSSIISESMTGIHEIQGNCAYSLEETKFKKAARWLYDITYRLQIVKFGIKFTNNLFQSIGPFILFLVGGYLAIQGKFQLGALVAFLSAYEKLYDPWKELMEFYQLYQDCVVRYRQVMDYFDLLAEFQSTPLGRDVYRFKGDIDLNDLSFTIGTNIRLLDNINMHIKPGEHLALVGFSGSGKSTLASAVGQMLKYTGGSVQLDGYEVANMTKQDIAENVGIVAQHPFIFDGTIRNNLVYSSEALLRQQGETEPVLPDLDRIIEVAQQVGLFVDVLGFGLRTTLNKEAPPELIESLIRARSQFQERHGAQLHSDIEFFDPEKYLQYASIAENIVFGAPKNENISMQELHKQKHFINFLIHYDLLKPLELLGITLATRTIDLIQNSPDEQELLLRSPVPAEKLSAYGRIVEQLRKAPTPESGLNSLDEEARLALLYLSLNFTPSQHSIASIPDQLFSSIGTIRKSFHQYMDDNLPGKFNAYSRDSYVYTLTIMDNIAYGHIKHDNAGAEERVQQHINQLLIIEGVLETILEIGLEHNVGNMGEDLSGGQRQKVALARAFLKRPPIYIFDEATSALDNASQTRIQNVMERMLKGKATILSVVHRLDTLPGYDKVAVLRSGKLVEQGTYEELMEKKGALYELIHGA
ncbi:ABC transporter ATP-binding protein/permease [Halodesulfovibrio spirochaetisodalis]|uniref:Antibiotic ABC transporter ATPase n=1 Tax=Halodesulfovibrio spirochaetisodalis TaxID=1560234 RepID=A0A1B7XB31_9BACT|nr:ABC transporter ATP-binding protein/permease [Halodesulfovibrio spirochaetisodalis]OBQ46574.1 antibiotic ABC transporter ATPase [Halodesulfovibrio spirochaetisodalis]